MQPIRGIDIQEFSTKDLVKIDDLIYFDGPLLSFYSNGQGDNYLYYWVDVDEVCNRWIVFPIDLNELNNYLNKKLTLYSLLIKTRNVYVLDLDNDIHTQNIWLTLISNLPIDYLPEEQSFYIYEKNSSDIFLKYYSIIHKKGVLQAHFSGGNDVGYGTMDLQLFSTLMNHFTDMNEGLGNSFYKIEKKKQEYRNKQNKSNKEKTINKNDYLNSFKFEVIGTLSASFSMILKSVDEECSFEDTPTRADKYIEFLTNFFSDSEYLDKFKEDFAREVDIAAINHYESFLKTLENAHCNFNIEYLNTVSNTSYSRSIDSPKAQKIIKNLETLDLDREESFSMTGHFVSLNLKNSKYSFESEYNKSSGILKGDASKKSFEIAFNKVYTIEIERKTTKKAAGKKARNEDVIKTLTEFTEENKAQVEG
jgi:hypothetical protein